MRPVSVGIHSIGEMGYGIAILLKAHGYRVLTVGSGRSERTLSRIRSASIESLSSDQELVIQSDYLLSIVPPRDALATARRIAEVCKLPDTEAKRQGIEDIDGLPTRRKLYYLDLNATPARLSAEVGSVFVDGSPTSESPSALCHFLDGGIIGPPPSHNVQDGSWKKPSLVVSGSVDLPSTFPRLSEILNMKLVSSQIGAASTLKLSVAALTKGLTALSIFSFSTAQKESLLPELLEHLKEYAPHISAWATKSVPEAGPKAYRFVEEMQGIGEMFDSEGNWDGLGAGVYGSIAEVYRTIAEQTELGKADKSQGQTVEEIAETIVRRKKAVKEE
ncbi:hypothetical protein ASPWEDRAFT_172394 [Aspergillus wentii DTO 134E9]|uniref:Phosphogluconate dehydrogenase NAD-binding putative C-terminal domain-containing protein n=1 Tax=Aspergillus wentii DTO 134E9 TaxID=1073089 RepID=A0A1L9RKY2_ASPWE|nr:uncharacterized protein ASPWEDRAFT_172394 [Aspergillus wentii DTO 134E9]KAI9924641.1 hypothetical protein MW887_006915 [Aspergillus wentii]OJJ35596.1 hypothetical protein ASPWEDRAFT_172394 [Aspergillus wentii DTO 134E9]